MRNPLKLRKIGDKLACELLYGVDRGLRNRQKTWRSQTDSQLGERPERSFGKPFAAIVAFDKNGTAEREGGGDWGRELGPLVPPLDAFKGRIEIRP